MILSPHTTSPLDAFEVQALDYLMKPVRAERLVAALSRAERFRTHEPRIEELAKTIGAVRSHLTVSERGRMMLVPIDDVVYLRAELKYVTIKTRTREFLTEESLTHSKRFRDRFVLFIAMRCGSTNILVFSECAARSTKAAIPPKGTGKCC